MAWYGKVANFLGIPTEVPDVEDFSVDIPGGAPFAIAKTAANFGGGIPWGSAMGSDRMYGLTEEQIRQQAEAQRAALQAMIERQQQTAMRGAARGASVRGMGQSGALAQAAPNIALNAQLAALQGEYNLAAMANAARQARTYVHTPGWLEQILPFLGQAGGAAIGGAIAGPPGAVAGAGIGGGVAQMGAAPVVSGGVRPAFGAPTQQAVMGRNSGQYADPYAPARYQPRYQDPYDPYGGGLGYMT